MTNDRDSRYSAFSVLHGFEKPGITRIKATVLMENILASNSVPVTRQDRLFCYALVQGVLRHWFRLESWMTRLAKRPPKKIEPKVRTLIKMGLFQLYGIIHVPAYATLDSTIKLARQLRCSAPTIRFINGVLRAASREMDSPVYDNPALQPPAEPPIECPTESLDNVLPTDDDEIFLKEYGWPAIWRDQLTPQYTPQDILAMAKAFQSVSTGLSIRVNTLCITPEDYIGLLKAEGFTVTRPDPEFLPEALWIEKPGVPPNALPGYVTGYYYVQEYSSMYVTRWLNPAPDQQVLDLCAAPGSKTTHMAALMHNTGHILASDNSASRLERLKENVSRLTVQNVTLQLAVPEEDNEKDLTTPFYDAVLVDAPCTASGTIRRHPEVLIQLCQKQATPHNKDTQLALLKKGFKQLKPGGTLVYSTCSLFEAENQVVVQTFLKEAPAARLVDESQRMLSTIQDGFYMAKLTKAL